MIEQIFIIFSTFSKIIEKILSLSAIWLKKSSQFSVFSAKWSCHFQHGSQIHPHLRCRWSPPCGLCASQRAQWHGNIICLSITILMILTKMTLMLLLKVSLYKKLMALLPAPEGCSKDEEGSLSTTEVFFTPINDHAINSSSMLMIRWQQPILVVQVVNSLVDFKPKVDQTSVENLLRWEKSSCFNFSLWRRKAMKTAELE